jgi:hypothetical protein
MGVGSNRTQLVEKPAEQIPWASSDNSPAILKALQEGLTVSLISTKRADFMTCFQDELLSMAIERNRGHQFDFLPVRDATTDRIVGLVEIAPLMQSAVAEGFVRSVMRPLSEENLIGADANILAFVRDADHHKFRLVVSGNEISGLVSWSDLQRLPARAALFGLVTYLEITMTNAIRSEFNGSDAWLDRLPSKRRKILRGKIEEAQVGDGLVDRLLFTQFSDKVKIIHRSGHLKAGSDPFEDELNTIGVLRNYLVHANDYASSNDAAAQTSRTVRLIDKWTEEFSRRFSPGSTSLGTMPTSLLGGGQPSGGERARGADANLTFSFD